MIPVLDKSRGLKKIKGTANVNKKTQEISAEVNMAATANSLRQDVIAILNYIGDKELKLTQAGNLTLMDTRAVNDLFVEPKELDSRIGDHVYKLSVEQAPDKYGHNRIVAFQMTKLGRTLLALY